MIQADQFQSALQLTCLVPSARPEWDIRTAEPTRPGMQFCGYYEFFAYERPQIIGKIEMSYLEARSPEERKTILARYFSYDLPCVIICRGMTPPAEMLEIAAGRGIPVYLTDMVTTRFTTRLVNYLNRCLAPHILRHGVLLDVFGVGVLLTGKSGVGKSEAALELIKRGHQLVADDAVDICRVSETRLIGTCPENILHLMEIRGIGLIDIRAMYGIGAVSRSKSIDLVLELVAWDEDLPYDRLGLHEQFIEILGVQVSHQLLPVRPGRNLAIIIEASARNLSLKRSGFNTADILSRRMQSQQAPAEDEESDIREGGYT